MHFARERQKTFTAKSGEWAFCHFAFPSMKTEKRHLSFNQRLITETLCKYTSTFEAFCELLTNAIQARADSIEIKLDYTATDKVSAVAFSYIEVKDNGHGVHVDEIEKKLLEVATDTKTGGQGIGRFAGLQIGKTIEIETCGRSPLGTGEITRGLFKINKGLLSAGNLADKDIVLESEVVSPEAPTFFRVRISELYSDEDVALEKRRRIVGAFADKNISAAIFERYAELIVTNRLKISINGRPISYQEFLQSEPQQVESSFVDDSGNKFQFKYQFLQLKTTSTQHRIFLRHNNAGVQCVGHTLTYEASIQEPYQWFVYVDSEYFNSRANIFRNIEFLSSLDPETEKLSGHIQSEVDKFFADKYPVYRNFIQQLSADTFYPYRTKKAPSMTAEAVFQQVAFAVENNYKLLHRAEKLRKLVYALIERCLTYGELEAVLGGFVDLKPEVYECFSKLIQKVELEEVLRFSSQVATKLQMLDFLHALNYSELAKSVKERKQLHKVVEKNLWLFGEEFNGTPPLWSDKNLANTLDDLRQRFLGYTASEDDDNINSESPQEAKDITDLCFYNERLLSDTESEIVVVELKAPKVRLSDKELGQATKYAMQIDGHPGLPSNLKFRVILVGSAANSIIREKLGAMDHKRPSLLFATKSGRVEVHVQTWSGIIESNRRKLSCMGDKMKVQDRKVSEVFAADFSAIEIHAELESKMKNA